MAGLKPIQPNSASSNMHLRAAAGPDGASLLLIAGKQLREPVAKGGPFVMNTEGEVRQAMTDYQMGRF